MALKSVHPSYANKLPDWRKVRDVYKGERTVKEAGTTYLPATQGMYLDGFGKLTVSGTTNVGQVAYDAYVMRAVLPDYVNIAVEGFLGLMHSNPPVIELPEAMEPLRENATQLGESLELLLRRINEEQLIPGRLGLLLDLPKNPDPSKPLPYISLYVAESVTNWDDGEIGDEQAKLNMVVLDESGYRRNGFDWDTVTQFRVLELERTPVPTEKDPDAVKWGAYKQGVFHTSGSSGEPTYVESDMEPPLLRGTPLQEIPFVFINSKDIVAAPDKPPLLTLAEACLTIYRGEADYRQNLFMQGQDTLLVKGEFKKKSDPNEISADDGPVRTGSGSMIHLEGGADSGAEYIGVTSEGLSEQRQALENDRLRAEGQSAAITATSSDNNASGEALKTRVGARTASLNQIAKTGAAGLEWLLKTAAQWMGADPEKVKVTPNLEFADFQLDGASLAAIVAAKQSGAPISWESVHNLMQRGNLTEMDYKTEKVLVDAEREDMVTGTGAGGNPGDE